MYFNLLFGYMQIVYTTIHNHNTEQLYIILWIRFNTWPHKFKIFSHDKQNVYYLHVNVHIILI